MEQLRKQNNNNTNNDNDNNNNNNNNNNNDVMHALFTFTPHTYFQSVCPFGFDLSSRAINLSYSAICWMRSHYRNANIEY